MIKTKDDLKLYLREDAKRNGMAEECLFKQFLRRVCGSEIAHINLWLRMFRKWEYHANNDHRLRAKYYEIRTKRIGFRLGISGRINTVGYGLRIMHIGGGGGVRLGFKKAGNYCGFNAGVVIGTNGGEDLRPVLGDHVAFGPGAKAFGNLTIGNNVFIAPNAVVTKDCESDAIYGGIPAKLIKRKKND